MNRFTSIAVGGAIAASGLLGGAVGAAIVGASSAAQTIAPVATTVPAAAATTAPVPGVGHSNEDPTHEAGESAAREAAENNGTATYGPPPSTTAPAQ